MKKILVVLMALAVAAPALADLKGSVDTKVYTVSGSSIEKDAGETSFSEIRVRPKFIFFNEWVESVVTFEIDQGFGYAEDSLAEKDPAWTPVKADQKGVVEIKNAYAKVKVQDVKGLNLMGGIAGYSFKGIFDTDAPLLSASYAGDWGSASLIFIKPSEGARAYAGDDSEIFGIDVSIKSDMLTVRPGLFIYSVAKESFAGNYADSTGIAPALNANIKAGELAVDFAFAYLMGKDKSGATEVDLTGMVADLQVTYSLDKDMSFGAFFTYMSGDDGTAADEKGDFKTAAFAPSDYVGIGRMYILENSGSFGSTDAKAISGVDARIDARGYMLVGASAKVKADKFAALLQLGYGMLAKDNGTTADKTDLGFEADVNLSYEIAPGAKVYTEFAYLATGGAYKASEGSSSQAVADTQAAIYAALGMSLKF